MILPIVPYGDTWLRQVSRPVPMHWQGLKNLLENMWHTLDHAQGAGLAAIQVGTDLQVFLADTGEAADEPVRKAFINPEITWYSSEQLLEEEGCLSIPGLQAAVPRAISVRMTYFDEDFHAVEAVFSGPLARIVQHEYDHTRGRLYLDYLSPLRRQLLRTGLERIRKGKASCPYPLRQADHRK
ncbi:peptide deformylase [Pedobacter yulinensis]|uniref:Peptide deformylase n=1 Tax=Pedobacter yulinensis TaxID=2126353 RepID=A0A2T3HMB9_9SPHI|nr:peptide deformylase [Pedobacter yulinensis]PST83602.1 peptide deformylase [Pedobacter yulinensis]